MEKITKRPLKALKGAGLGLLVLAASAGPSLAADAYLVAREFTKQMPDGTSVVMWGFAKDADNDLATIGTEAPEAPGPMITVPENDATLNIHLRNELSVPVSIVIDGQPSTLTPVKFIDASGRERVQSFTAETAPPPGPGVYNTGTYTWTDVRPGTCIYHSGTHPSVQVQMGLYGGVRKDAAPGQAYAGVSYDKEVVLFYSEIDPALHAAVAGGTYGTPGYPGTMSYKPRYFLVNGEPWSAAQSVIQAGNINDKVLIRFLNAGLETHVPMLQGQYMNIVAEDGNPYSHPKERYTVPLPALKTSDAVFVPKRADKYPVYDRRLFLANADVPTGGMLSILEVTEVSGAPTANNDSYSTPEDTPLTVAAPGVLANDTDPEAGALTAALAAPPASGSLTLNADGSFTFSPSANFNGSETFQYKASDGALESNVATVTVSVAPVADAPVANNDSATTDQDVAINIDVLANDSDADGGTLTVTGLTAGANGSTLLNGDDTVTYTPNAGFFGQDTFTYMANDGTSSSGPATVTVTVNQAVNVAPVAQDDYATTRRNTAVAINVLANDSDVDGTLVASSVTATKPTRGGTAVVNANGSITYTPRQNFRGTDTFTYTVRDDDGAVSNAATVRVNVVR